MQCLAKFRGDKKNECLKEFIKQFDKLLQDLPILHKHIDQTMLDQYIEVVPRHMSYPLKDGGSQSLDHVKTYVVTIERNLRTSKIDMLSYPRAKLNSSQSQVPKLTLALQAFSQMFDKVTSEPIQVWMAMMNKISILERKRRSRQNYPPQTQFNNDRPPWRNPYNGKNPSQQNVPNTHAPTNVVRQKGFPSCQTCNDFHSQEECPYSQVEEMDSPEHLNMNIDHAPLTIVLNESFSLSQQQHKESIEEPSEYLDEPINVVEEKVGSTSCVTLGRIMSQITLKKLATIEMLPKRVSGHHYQLRISKSLLHLTPTIVCL